MIIIVMLSSIIWSGCNKESIEDANERQILEYLEINGLTAERHSSGLHYIIDEDYKERSLPENILEAFEAHRESEKNEENKRFSMLNFLSLFPLSVSLRRPTRVVILDSFNKDSILNL